MKVYRRILTIIVTLLLLLPNAMTGTSYAADTTTVAPDILSVTSVINTPTVVNKAYYYTRSGDTFSTVFDYGTNIAQLRIYYKATAGAVVSMANDPSDKQVVSGAIQDLRSPLTYKVTANGQSRTITINATVAKPSIFSFGLTSNTVVPVTGNTINVVIPTKMSTTKLRAYFKTIPSNGTVMADGNVQLVSGKTSYDYSRPVTLTITTPTGETNTYTVTVTKSDAPVATGGGTTGSKYSQSDLSNWNGDDGGAPYVLGSWPKASFEMDQSADPNSGFAFQGQYTPPTEQNNVNNDDNNNNNNNVDTKAVKSKFLNKDTIITISLAALIMLLWAVGLYVYIKKGTLIPPKLAALVKDKIIPMIKKYNPITIQNGKVFPIKFDFSKIFASR